VATLAAACGRPEARPMAPVPAVPTPAADVGIDVVCGGRPACREVERHAAGIDAHGQALTVIQLAFAPDEAAEAASDDTESDDAESCKPFEYWLVTGAGTSPSDTQLLLTVCNDGYGAAGVGEDDVAVGANTFTHSRLGGSSWRWDTTTTVRLAPLEILEERHGESWTLGDNEQSSLWSWRGFRGRAAGTAIACGPDGDPPGHDGGADVALPYAYIAIPQVTVPAAFRDGGWRTTGLGACAATIDSATAGPTDDDPVGRGWVVHGSPGAAADARMSVVADLDGALYVEVHDDMWHSGAKSWLRDDHLEMWLGDRASSGSPCLTPATLPTPRQWGIRISDGAVFPAHGKPGTPFAVEVEPPRANGPARLMFRPPAGFEAITLVYSDSDDGVQQERLIATSELAFGKPWTFGVLRTIAADRAVCDVAAGTLTPRLTRHFRRDEPVIDD